MNSVSGVGVLDKSMLILSALESGPQTLGELVAQTGINRATTHRLASALVLHGLVRRTDGGRFSLGLRCLSLATNVTETRLADLAQPVLDELRSATEESTQLYVVDGDERVCIAAAESPHGLRTIVPVGERLTMKLGSAARVLAGSTGPGLVASVAEREAGVASVSAPVFGAGGVIAAISVSGPVDRTTSDPEAKYGALVLEAAQNLTDQFSRRPRPPED
jgi:DNA-binding IclR family transcriptional regulator